MQNKTLNITEYDRQLLLEAMVYMQDMQNDLALENIEAVNLYDREANEVMDAERKALLRDEIVETLQRSVAINVLKARLETL